MRASIKLSLELSEKRQRHNELASKGETVTAEEKAEIETLQARLLAIEPELRAAMLEDEAAEQRARETFTNDAQGAERRALIDGADVGAIFEATLEHRATDGQTAELQTELGLQSNQVPLAMLKIGRREPEHRATGVTPAPTNGGITQPEIIPAVFPESSAAFLGVDMPTVGAGDAVFPVLSTSADAGVPAENAAQDEKAGAFTANILTPGRIQASFFYSREDRARFVGMSDALRMNLSDALADKLDQQVLNGSEGLLNGTNLDNHNVSTQTTHPLYLTQFGFGRVDGKYAAVAADLRIVAGSATYAHMGGTYRSGNTADYSVLERLMAITGGIKVSAHVPAVASNKQNAVIRLGMRRDMVAALWDGVTLIPDEITLAKKGQIQITAVLLHAIKILRADGFHKQQSQHA